MTNGEELVVRCSMKPLPTLMRPLQSVDLATGEAGEALVERSDVAAVEALAVVAEAAVAFELAKAAHEKFGGDAIGDFVAAHAAYLARIAVATRPRPPIALVGFMGAGKTTLGAQLAERARAPVPRHRRGDRGGARPDRGASSRAGRGRVPRARGEHACRGARARARAAVIALGGGAVRSRPDPRGAAERASPSSSTSTSRPRGAGRRPDRPLAQDEAAFRALFDERQSALRRGADARAPDVDGRGPRRRRRPVERCARAARRARPGTEVALVADRHVAGIWGPVAQTALGARLASVHELPPGEEAKTVASYQRLSRTCASSAATRSSPSAAAVRPTRRASSQRPTCAGSPGSPSRRPSSARWTPASAARPGSTSRPARTSSARSTGRRGRRGRPGAARVAAGAAAAKGMAEVVKTGLLAGEPIWEWGRARCAACAAYKARVCLRDPHDRGERDVLNLGHTFAHALEAAAPTGRRTARRSRSACSRRRGSPASTRRSSRSTLRPEPVAVDRDRAWAAIARDKKDATDAAARPPRGAGQAAALGVELPADAFGPRSTR